MNDTAHENTKSFTVELSSPLGGAATVGSPATVRIVDDDAAPVVTDRTPPSVTLSGFPSKTTFAKLVKGVRVTVSAGEAATFDATLEARALRAQIAAAAPFNLTLAHANVGRLSTKATLRLRPKRRLLGSPRRLTVRVRLTATDAAGNHTEKTRTIAVRRR